LLVVAATAVLAVAMVVVAVLVLRAPAPGPGPGPAPAPSLGTTLVLLPDTRVVLCVTGPTGAPSCDWANTAYIEGDVP
jgi:hypothetical protein